MGSTSLPEIKISKETIRGYTYAEQPDGEFHWVPHMETVLREPEEIEEEMRWREGLSEAARDAVEKAFGGAAQSE